MRWIRETLETMKPVTAPLNSVTMTRVFLVIVEGRPSHLARSIRVMTWPRRLMAPATAGWVMGISSGSGMVTISLTLATLMPK
ncbi:hypothetical protein D3C87_2011490 [compost metagenome]